MIKKTAIITHCMVFSLIILVFTLGCGENEGVFSTDPEPMPTHTMQEVYDDIHSGIKYTDQTITIQGTVIDVNRKTANEDEFILDTSKLIKQEYDEHFEFSIIAERDKYKIGVAYTFSLLIEFAYCESDPDGNRYCWIRGRQL